MSTKFVSKNSNYMVVLRPGVEGNRALGTHAINGLYVKFVAGIVDVKEDQIINMLREHPSYGIDFMEVKPNEVDPYAEERAEIEPPHTTTEIKYGHAEKSVGTPRPVKMTPAMKKMVENEAKKMIPSILKNNPEILKDIMVKMAEELRAKEAAAAEPKKAEEITEKAETEVK